VIELRLLIQVGLGDFCMDPIGNTLQTLVQDSSTYSVVSYYMTCEGQSPYSDDISSAESSIAQFSETVDLMEVSCSENAYVKNMANILPQVYSTLEHINATMLCPPFQQHAQSTLEHGICHSGFSGFFTIWAGQFFTAFALFILCVSSSIAYQYFEWTVKPDDEYCRPSEAADDNCSEGGTAIEMRQPFDV
jgi:hypothetical protein